MVRRSARLRGNTPSTEEAKPSPVTVAKLSSLAERDETPEVGSQPNIETVMSTPAAKCIPEKTAVSSIKSQLARTPTTAGDVKPPREEMHPSKARHSTTKQPDTGLILGFNPIKRDANGNVIKEGILESTPTKAKGSPRSDFGTPAYDVKFSCQDAHLSEEAKKLMENVREDVARIKAKMILDKAEQARKEHQAENLPDVRKIAKPKGKASRFSEAHMAEFKKMDSIAGHPSAFRATPGRFQPVTKPLKRKSSKACLDERPSPCKTPTTPSRIAELATAKRVKKSEGDDASTGRPETNTDQSKVPRPAVNPRPKASIRSSLMTPTKASSLRAATVRPSKVSMLPVARSPLSKMIPTPRTPQTEFNPRLKSHLPSLGNLKSILRRHQPLFSNDPVKIAAGTHIATPDFNPDIPLDKLSTIAFNDTAQTPSPKKRVEFTSSTKSRYEPAQPSPSPSKIPAPSAKVTESDVVYPTLPLQTPEKEKSEPKQSLENPKTPTIRRVRETAMAAATASPFPNMPAVPHGIINKKRHRADDDDDDDKDVENIPPEPNGERSSKRQKISSTPVAQTGTPSPMKKQPVKSTTPGSILQTKQATPASARQKGKRVLSLSRLHMLAKPKQRG